ncbi:MAG: CoA transferase [Deltaproteobacteria bacterium]|nr:MAG: CoA transferase [Deltaproteobacteria bacterium]
MSDRPLKGLRVLDFADEKGELCGRLLADFGGDVIRVEPPEGARSRLLPPFHAGESLYYAYRNAGKRGIVLDLRDPGDVEALHAQLRCADVWIESFGPGHLESLGFDFAELIERYPKLLIVRISDFGQTGPYRDWVGDDAVLEAMSGMVWKAGIPAKPPLLPPSPMAYDIAGIMGAFATLATLRERNRSGYGQIVDLSVLEAVAQTTDWSMSNASVSVGQGIRPVEVRMGSGPLYTIYKCKGGYVRLIVLSPRQWRAMWEWLGKPEAFADPHFETFIARLQNADVLIPLYTEHFSTLTMEEVSAEAQRRGIVCTPVLRPEEVLANEHLLSRKTFADMEIAPGVSGPMAAGFFEIDGVRQGPRSRAPAIGEHTDAVLNTRVLPKSQPSDYRPAPGLPLSGLRVLDFGIGGVGVEAGRLFAEYGADVIKIESRTYPDFIRVVLSTELSPSYASSSRSKRSFGVNAKNPEGFKILKRLIHACDVLIENSKTGAMEGMGIGWETIRQWNPYCVMVSSQLLGARGAWSDWIGYGPSTQPVGGLVHLWNYADQEAPAGSTSIFPDHLAGRLAAINALALLHASERTHKGAHGEVAQVEVVTGILGDLLWKAGVEPGSVAPRGNRSDRGAPWGAYPCAGEQQWCVIAIRDDDDWRRLVAAIGSPAWAADPALARAEGRFAAHDAIDGELGKWTRERTKYDVAVHLQEHGVPCGPVLTGSEQLEDPHFLARGYVRWIDQQVVGKMAFEGPAFHATGTQDVVLRQAPRHGEHTREICKNLLRLDEATLEQLIADGALEVPSEG